MQEAIAHEGARLAPSLSVATPIFFGPRAAATALIPPDQPPEFDLQPTGMFNFPDEPERFVGRLLPMLRATQGLAPGSARRGVLFHGMAGGRFTSSPSCVVPYSAALLFAASVSAASLGSANLL